MMQQRMVVQILIEAAIVALTCVFIIWTAADLTDWFVVGGEAVTTWVIRISGVLLALLLILALTLHLIEKSKTGL